MSERLLGFRSGIKIRRIALRPQISLADIVEELHPHYVIRPKLIPPDGVHIIHRQIIGR